MNYVMKSVKIMSVLVKEIVENVNSYTRGHNGELNATTEFKQLSNLNLVKIKEVLKNENATSKELIKSLDDLVYTILDYRYNIVDYLHYTDDPDDNGRAHLRVN